MSQTASGVLWFDALDGWLSRLERINEGFQELDTMPTQTKREKEEKRKVFDKTMRMLHLNHEFQDDIERMRRWSS